MSQPAFMGSSTRVRGHGARSWRASDVSRPRARNDGAAVPPKLPHLWINLPRLWGDSSSVVNAHRDGIHEHHRKRRTRFPDSLSVLDTLVRGVFTDLGSSN